MESGPAVGTPRLEAAVPPMWALWVPTTIMFWESIQVAMWEAATSVPPWTS